MCYVLYGRMTCPKGRRGQLTQGFAGSWGPSRTSKPRSPLTKKRHRRIENGSAAGLRWADDRTPSNWMDATSVTSTSPRTTRRGRRTLGSSLETAVSGGEATAPKRHASSLKCCSNWKGCASSEHRVDERGTAFLRLFRPDVSLEAPGSRWEVDSSGSVDLLTNLNNTP